MKRIPLRRRGAIVGFAIVDDDDYALVATRRWQIGTSGYATAQIGGRTALMHRLILGLTRGDGKATDHINRNKLDNRRANLRVGTAAENNQNRVRPPGHSRFRGVASYAGTRWRARAKLNGKYIHLGVFDDELDAARAAAAWRAEHMPFSSDAVAKASS